ncbi:hypothetical protein SAMD00019534_110970 [Acytostelium subglobosum LB1]|uniref:hypothetical protein n=1 Tax=Acytostelium subglobosum LB1 TaxID=1410327 RepID=UPI0006451185|nr:hypothetical protein SAMD00019534_110970 [Acytostelium subglobosum LB1]GAM27921.1 hypothetical protein SAMD00019534_110970 [Acytostelium subglobosum LB1]|eukprot:XP_012749204.1 hypothetical protein SAMD00019534_110970 [Acytostelium subglobosum LB1]
MVNVHYVGSLLNGTIFDSSRQRGKPFQFTVGQGRVINGWEEAIPTMKPGEIATFTITPDLGYGAKSLPGIPANSTLVFEIELIDFM